MLCVKCLTHLFFIWWAVSIYYLFSHFLQSFFLFFIMAQIKFLSNIIPELRTRISSVIYKKYKAKYKYVMTVNNVFLFLTYFTFKRVIVVFNLDKLSCNSAVWTSGIRQKWKCSVVIFVVFIIWCLIHRNTFSSVKLLPLVMEQAPLIRQDIIPIQL